MHHTRQIPKIIGWAILLHALLIGLTVLEVAIYSTFFNSGQDITVYDQHAQKSGPIVGIIAGFILVYLLTCHLIKRSPGLRTILGLGIPLGYILTDLLIVLVAEQDVLGNAAMFSASYLTKLFAGFLAIRVTSKSARHATPGQTT